ncbi:MAG: hypothetical protein ACLGXA_03970 [Acidobacteriota bacterium]
MPQRRITVYRMQAREPSASDVEIVLPGRGLQYDGKIVFLSPESCVLDTKCRLEPGTLVEVWMRTERMPLRVLANLVERRATGVEFHFHEMTGRKMDQIETLRGELAQEAARAQEKQLEKERA